jgi:hypothetical protein
LYDNKIIKCTNSGITFILVQYIEIRTYSISGYDIDKGYPNQKGSIMFIRVPQNGGYYESIKKIYVWQIWF